MTNKEEYLLGVKITGLPKEQAKTELLGALQQIIDRHPKGIKVLFTEEIDDIEEPAKKKRPIVIGDYIKVPTVTRDTNGNNVVEDKVYFVTQKYKSNFLQEAPIDRNSKSHFIPYFVEAVSLVEPGSGNYAICTKLEDFEIVEGAKG